MLLTASVMSATKTKWQGIRNDRMITDKESEEIWEEAAMDSVAWCVTNNTRTCVHSIN